MTIQAHPLAWPTGWRRTANEQRKRATFGVVAPKSNSTGQTWSQKRALTIADAVKRVRIELDRLGVDVANDLVISTNLRLNLAGMPRGDQGEPEDPGAGVYWTKPGEPTRVMAIDAYTRVADNLGAIAATLEAMRAIERHGGAQILDRAFSGFDALPAPKTHWDILGLRPDASRQDVQRAWRELVAKHHPDRGGSEPRVAEINAARDQALKEARP